MQFDYTAGDPAPLGTTITKHGVNFALYAPSAEILFLNLFSLDRHLIGRLKLDPQSHRTRDIWHVEVRYLPRDFLYGYQVNSSGEESHILIDPYSVQIDAPSVWGSSCPPYLSQCAPHRPFDWEDDVSPNLPMEDLIIYELHTRGFTQDPSAQAAHPGTFLGVIEKIPYLKNLGVNALEFMPIYEFPEWENPFTKPSVPRYNYWGYAPSHHFVPMRRYGTIDEFKQMVQALHQAQIEVILDVVYNHTAESLATPLHFRAFGPKTYYILDSQGADTNFSGCGNTLSCNHPIVEDWILASLRYWSQEMHVDGFRFDLASILCRDPQGHILSVPPIIERILNDPALASKKLIAEAWDAGGAYQVGSFSNSPRWMEWNGRYRDEVRLFIKGNLDTTGVFATRLCGSVDLYKNRGPQCSVNFVCCHDGFTLKDLVSYSTKHNLTNGEDNRDGTNQHLSWNCGCEGSTLDPKIQSLRLRQMKNFLMALFLSKGVPLIQMGDEYGHSKQGNNNSWGLDSPVNWFQWNWHVEEQELFSFCQLMIRIRKQYKIIRSPHFLTHENITFHGVEPGKPLWSKESHLVAYTLEDVDIGNSMYIVFHASAHPTQIKIPPSPTGKWYWQINTYVHNQPLGSSILESPLCTIPEYTAWLCSSRPTLLDEQDLALP